MQNAMLGDSKEEPFDRLFRTKRRAHDDPAYSRLLHAAANAGDPRALFSLGTWSVTGSRALRIKRNRDQAGALVLAGGRHFCVAALWAADWYERGHVLPRDPSRAVTWYRRAARLGSVLARYELGRCWAVGIGVTVNKAIAARYYAAARRFGHDDEADRTTGRGPFPEPYDRALLRFYDGHQDAEYRRLVEIGAAAGDGRAQYQLSRWLASGCRALRIRADPARAHGLLATAARHVGAAAHALGTWHERGYIVRRDSAMAVAFYQRARRLGSVAARLELARCYAEGVGVAVNLDRVDVYLTEAAEFNGESTSVFQGLERS